MLKNRITKLVSHFKNDEPQISVILPVYNVEKYLSRCIESIIRQDLNNIEIICVNDGSTDRSLNILQDYAKKDKRIKIVSQKNCGLGCARNTGFKHARGNYILFVDSDDFLSENVLKDLYSNAVSNDSDLVIFKFNTYDEVTGKYSRYGIPLDKKFKNCDFNNFTFTYRDMKDRVMNSYISAWGRLYKKEFIDEHDFSFPVSIAYEDVLYQIRCYLYAQRISFTPDHVYNYRVSNTDSIMHDTSKIFDIIKVCDSVESFLKDSSFMDEFEVEFLMFKILQLSMYIPVSSGNEYFDRVKAEYEKMGGEYDLSKLPEKSKVIYQKVMSSKDLNEYLE